MNEALKKVLAEWQEKAKSDTGEMLRAKFCGIVTKDLGDGQIEAVVATDSLDRHGEYLDIKGVDIKSYMKNPVVLWAHDYQALPVGKTESLTKTPDGKLVAKMTFAINEDEFAHKVYKMLKGGFLNAFSIGFIPTDAAEKDGHTLWTKSQMLEYSVVPVPANAEALQMAKSLNLELAKGAVADKLDEEQKFDEKLLKMQGFWDLVYAFCDTYYAKETEPGDFSKLLKEFGELITGLADGTETKAAQLKVEHVDAGEIVKYLGVEKAGKVLSAKNREAVEAAVSALNTVLEADSATEKNVDDSETRNIIDVVKKATLATEQLVSQATKGGAGRSPQKQKLLIVKAKKSAQIADKAVELLIGNLNGQIK